MATNPARTRPRHPGTAWEVFRVFLRLGLTSFGGPVAHLGYFREAFVQRRSWLDERAYADLVGLCQFLPGPSSSQVGMALGLQRAGMRGLLAAWAGFTLPSALLLFGFALGAPWLGELLGNGWIAGLKAAAVAVVAHAVLGMARVLTPDARRATLALGTLALVLLLPGPVSQVGALATAALIGALWLPAPPPETAGCSSFSVRLPRMAALGCLAVFGLLLVALPLLATATGSGAWRLAEVFYRAGSLVFGGGHVVLPLLEAEVVRTGLVGQDAFLAGYGAAQAVPGPLFTFAAFLGASASGALSPAGGAAVALLAIFLPSALLVAGVLPFWGRLRHIPGIRRALTGINAAVVGLLAAALYSPVFVHGVPDTASFVVAAAAFVALAVWRTPAWAVALAAAALGWLML